VRALRLKLQIDFREAFNRYVLALRARADPVVLAVVSLERAAGEEHRAGAARSADAGFFPGMQGCAGDAGEGAYAADA
jgi:hypothetical protein